MFKRLDPMQLGKSGSFAVHSLGAPELLGANYWQRLFDENGNYVIVSVADVEKNKVAPKDVLHIALGQNSFGNIIAKL